MIASVHIADIGPRAAIGLLRRTPRPATTPGLRHAHLALAAPLSGRVLPSPQLGRVGLVAFWDDSDALDQFVETSPIATALADGWHARLEPLRAFGTWPGLPADVPVERNVEHDGPAVVLTLGRLRFSQALRFMRASAKASGRAVDAPGKTWGTALARPPFLATCTMWESTRALSTYAYGQADPAHPGAMAEDRREPFHHQSAFIRFRPAAVSGGLGGRNPTP
jgi:hypothetical protein